MYHHSTLTCPSRVGHAVMLVRTGYVLYAPLSSAVVMSTVTWWITILNQDTQWFWVSVMWVCGAMAVTHVSDKWSFNVLISIINIMIMMMMIKLCLIVQVRIVLEKKTPFYSCVLSYQAFDLEWGWRWPCCDRDHYLVSKLITK